MRATATICIWIVRVAGTLQLLLGALFWTGHAYSFLPLHIVSGATIVLTLWTSAVPGGVHESAREVVIDPFGREVEVSSSTSRVTGAAGSCRRARAVES